MVNPDLAAAVTRLRMRACWTEVPALLRGEDRDFSTLFALAASAVERCAFTAAGWDPAGEALREATEVADSAEERAQVLGEGAFLCYAQTVFDGVDHADDARRMLGQAERLIGEHSPLAPLLAFRRGLITENLDGDHDAARQFYAQAHQAAQDAGDELFLSFTYRHFGIVDRKAGRIEQARYGFTKSLELREKVGFLIGIAPALSGLARVSDEPDASRLRNESRRLVRILGLASRLGQ